MDIPRHHADTRDATQDAVITNAAKCGVTLIAGKGREPTEPLAKVLLLDEMYVIADGFRVEPLA